ncbi:3-hydroxyacyl-CoA dehydrogenase family protein [Micromonospora sp.]|uniref:3-hydroxyacyl-CoA dehydrogenase family protein n=1 Tax=Micromonospora sp. TaxID=1876 RepID=UPI003B3B34BA
MINTAVRVVAAGTAGVESVDTLLQGSPGHPTGPLRTADLIDLESWSTPCGCCTNGPATSTAAPASRC